MPNIQINIKNKVARADKAIIVCDNSDYTAVFDFDAEWDAYTTKTARFVYGGRYTDVVFSGNECPVPVIQDTRAVTVGVFAGDLHTTTPAYISCVPSILCSNGIPADPTPDVYNQLMELLNAISLGGNPATAETLGLIKVGENLTITEDGVLSAVGESVTEADALVVLADSGVAVPVTNETGTIYTDEAGNIMTL